MEMQITETPETVYNKVREESKVIAESEVVDVPVGIKRANE